MKEDNTMFYQAIGNSIQANKDKIEKLEKQNERLKKKNKSLQSQLEAKEEVEKKFIKYLEYQVKLQEELNDIHLATGFEEILSKYKEIIGYDK